MTKAIEQNESFLRPTVRFLKYSLINHCFLRRFEGFIPDNFSWKIAEVPSIALRNFDWNRTNVAVEVIGSGNRIKRLHYGFEVSVFNDNKILRRSDFPPHLILHDKLRAIVPSFVENTDDYTRRVFACESFSI
jgi:hypothetical protein